MDEQIDQYFDYVDYIVFGAMLVISAFVGIHFAFFAKVKQNTTSEYLMGSKTMGIFPISMSLIASYISGISILGLPAEMYTYGTQLYMFVITHAFVSITMAVGYLPVFYKLEITSSYESVPVSSFAIQPKRPLAGLNSLPAKNDAVYSDSHICSGTCFQPSNWNKFAFDHSNCLRSLHFLHNSGWVESSGMDRYDPDVGHVWGPNCSYHYGHCQRWRTN